MLLDPCDQVWLPAARAAPASAPTTPTWGTRGRFSQDQGTQENHWRPSRYPSSYTPANTGSCVFTISKTSSDVCQLRLDFEVIAFFHGIEKIFFRPLLVSPRPPQLAVVATPLQWQVSRNPLHDCHNQVHGCDNPIAATSQFPEFRPDRIRPPDNLWN